MPTILIINTAFETASVILTKGAEVVLEMENNQQKDHALFLEPAIRELCNRSSSSLNNIDAVAVVNGPGSYTGLRVGLSSAKAICYALNKPLLLLNSLDVMALALQLQVPDQNQNILYCPLIDARRMEVFTAVYDAQLNLVSSYTAAIIDQYFLHEEINNNFIIFGGSGGFKLKKYLNEANNLFIYPLSLTKPSAILAEAVVIKGNFADIAYSEPFYLKPVYFSK